MERNCSNHVRGFHSWKDKKFKKQKIDGDLKMVHIKQCEKCNQTKEVVV